MIVLYIGNGTEHLVNLVGLDKLFHVVQCALIDCRCRFCPRVVVKEAHDVVAVALIAQHLIDEANPHGAAADDDDALEVEAAVAIKLHELARNYPPRSQRDEEDEVEEQYALPRGIGRPHE